MKKLGIVAVLIVLVGMAGALLAGTSGLSNTVTKWDQPRVGGDPAGLAYKAALFNDSVVTKLDAMTTADGLEPENLNSGEAPADVTHATIVDGSPPSAATSATNGQVVTLSGYINLLKGTGSPNVNTNTITLANGVKGATYIVFNDTAATNLIAIAKTGNFKSPAIELAAGEGAVVVFVNTNAVYAIEK